MNNIGYRIMRGIIYALSLLPFRMLYVLSDILYVLVYKIVGYRRKTVSKNLRNSFPDKTKAELLKIERDFYHSFCDNMVEMFKLLLLNAIRLTLLICSSCSARIHATAIALPIPCLR